MTITGVVIIWLAVGAAIELLGDFIKSEVSNGHMCKGGQNPPNTSKLRPAPPFGSDGRQWREKMERESNE